MNVLFRIACLASFLLLTIPALAEEKPAEKTASEKAISDAIKLLEKERDTIGDVLEQAKVDKAIRELEALIEDPDAPKTPAVTLPKITFEVSVAALKRKFAGKPHYNEKTGELTLTYDFATKAQLTDFDVKDNTVAVVRKKLGIDAGDKLTHIAKFRSFTASAEMTYKSLRGVGISSTNGSRLATGGANAKTIFLGVPDGTGANKVVPDNLRIGSAPVSLSVTPQKTSIRFGPEKLSQATARKEDVHQITLMGGTEGAAFSDLIIVGVPDPEWLKGFLGVE